MVLRVSPVLALFLKNSLSFPVENILHCIWCQWAWGHYCCWLWLYNILKMACYHNNTMHVIGMKPSVMSSVMTSRFKPLDLIGSTYTHTVARHGLYE